MKIRIPHQLKLALMAIAFGLLIGALLILFTGYNPFAAYTALFQGGLMSIRRIANTLANSTTLILTGLSVAFAFRTGLFNIGASGQMLIGGMVATVLGLSLDLPKPLLLTVMLVGAAAAGALWGFIPGILKARFNVHEVVATIMMNFVALWTTYYTIQNYFTAEQETQSATLPSGASLQVDWLRQITDRSFLNLGLFLALILVVIIGVIINKSVLGYELKAAGYNRFASEYAGMNVNRNIVLSMVIAGMLAGIAGFTYYAGYSSHLEIGKLPTQGFDGIAVALLGANTPIGVLLSAVFFGLLLNGKGFMQSVTGVPPEIGDIIIGVIIYGSATSVLFDRLLTYFQRGRNKK
ncbi:ABC transporter permease [Spirochaeta lutea]|uniref:ABC transporter permease n=1 Tax=Spirochaeta lutea TaxID=1480694 RepID=UPI000A9BD178|nr:ABC transporter permease [Spirochaeta lutea]